ncbi:uncharacterized protein C4orf54 homolog [Syngnathus scovelli]|uniref:uncharacterized protein C4orf54 homolog n=1 Tax=Syngnathus scovelli TaxID=161590 RepID=UPI0021108168|nr:uncharacterized protein C4orf54 homolog [Syngnathus scovelli]XP_049616185.1 uncharacterized protein C4orf54 homolog [Syngnathus scovelli]
MKTERSHAVTPPPPQPPTLREVTDLLQIVDSDGKSSEFDPWKQELEDVGQQMSDLGIETDSDEYEDEDEDDVTVVTEDESHYITTHAIRLSELSDGHDGDSDPGAGSSSSSTWDAEDGQQVFFVDYASFDCNGVLMMKREGEAAITSLHESDPSSQFSACGQGGGQVHLSIKTTSRAINDPIQENTVYHAKDARDTSPSAAGGVDGNIEVLRDRAKGLIPAPGGKLSAKESAEYSSCASSELDDADKEVRNLTAKAFKSLAYPYLDAINFSTSTSESSTSERGINRWSTFVDLKYSNVSQSLVSQSTAERGGSNSDFTEQLNGNEAHQSASSTKKIELMRNFGQEHNGVIHLTETLKFRCNVKSGMSTGERRANVAPNPTGAGSHSTDEITVNSLQGGRGRGATAKSKSMEDTHKKAIFASSVIQNVLSKKMQFEQERRMERGEVREPHHKGDCHRGKGLQRQSSKPSESNSDSAEDLSDSMDCGSRRDSLVRDTPSEAPAKAMDAIRGAMEASKGTLLRSQNSAFRSWRNEQLEFPQDHKNHKTPEETPTPEGMGVRYSPSGGGKLTKMSHLFVPNIQRVASGGELDKASQLGSDHTLNIPESRVSVAASKSPEIKINLQSCHTANSIKTDDSKGQGVLAAGLKGESSDKVPHFMIRDIRDGKGKLQTPIHQVRDVRKLVKSSYHFVSLDHKSDFATADSHQDHRYPTSVSPIVIKCQSVNTNSSKGDLSEDTSSPEGNQSLSMQRVTGKVSPRIIEHPSEEMSLRMESTLASKKEQMFEVTDKQQMSNQVALKKLQAAVKTMEQLYVFDKNEWKRKNQPRPLMDSHVLSLIASEENSEEEALRGSVVENIARKDSNLNKTPPTVESWLRTTGDQDDALKARSVAASVNSSLKASAGITMGLTAKTLQPNNATPVSYNTKTFAPKSAKLPTSLKVCPTKTCGESKEILATEQSSDYENYLTIPVKSQASGSKEGLSVFSGQSRPTCLPLHIPASGTKGQEEQSQRSSNTAMATHPTDVPPATIFHSMPPGMSTNQPQVYCISPAITPAPVLDPFQTTQRKMLLDPTSGNYYLVDTPVQPSTRRLFDPETGQYVEVPMPQPPMTPLSMPISPMALGAAAYGHTYMIYPGFMTSPPVISTRTLVQPQVLMDSGEKAPPHQSEGMYMETPSYMTTGNATSMTPNVVSIARPQQGILGGKQPVISITSQQGPRIIAPPSFDGTTMSFVVEHR